MKKKFNKFTFNFFSDSNILLNFLKFNDFDLEKSKSHLVENIQMRKKHPVLFTDRDLFGEKFQSCMKAHQIIPLKKHTTQNMKVSVFRALEGGMKNLNAVDIYRLIVATLDARFLDDSAEIPDGDIVIYDMAHFGFKHLMKFVVDPINMKTWTSYCQDFAPYKIVQIHFINCSSVVPKLMTFVKPFLNKEVAESLRFHKTLESLHEMVEKDCLPNEFGGTLGKIDELFEDWKKIFMAKR
jgi:hypothetical protein